MQQIKEEMRNGQVALEKYVITKALTKPPEAYTDSKSQPHVQVSMRAIIRIIPPGNYACILFHIPLNSLIVRVNRSSQVALRMRQRGYKEGFGAKDTVPYIICYEQVPNTEDQLTIFRYQIVFLLKTFYLSSAQGGASSGSSAGIADRARHPDEVKSDDSRWMVDIDYYLAHQIHPVVSRLCAEIQGTSPERLAECLGLDPSKVKQIPY